MVTGSDTDGRRGAGRRTPADAAGVSVRRVTADDWAALRQARLAALGEAPWAFGSTLEHELALGEAEWRQRTTSAAWYLAWQGGETVGLAAAFPRPPAGSSGPAQAGPAQAGPAQGDEWHLVSMWASPLVRGQGVAGLLVDAVAAHAAEAGGRSLTLWVAAGNDRAHGFYRRVGFRPTGRQQVYRRRDGSAFDEQELALDLPGKC